MASWAYFDTSCLVKLMVAEAKTRECSEGRGVRSQAVDGVATRDGGRSAGCVSSRCSSPIRR